MSNDQDNSFLDAGSDQNNEAQSNEANASNVNSPSMES